jgi:amidase
MADSLGAFAPDGRMTRQAVAVGPLAGLSFAVKDLFAVAGHTATCGSPAWAASHAPADADAPPVTACLEAGATLIGRTIMDELAYSLTGANPHYGTPTNPDAPGRFTGGSSCGSAAVVAGGVADFALGTDTGGSIRVPASYCGVYGLRPTHGAISLDAAMPLAPRFDTVGWFARDAETLRAVGDVLLPADAPATPELPARLAVATDALELADMPAQQALAPWIDRVRKRFEGGRDVALASDATGPLDAWTTAFRDLQAKQAYHSFAGWVAAVQPEFGPEMQTRWRFVTEMAGQDTGPADARRDAVAARMAELTAGGTVIAVPCAPGAAPLMSADAATLAEHRKRALTLTAPAGLAGLPQIALPLATVQGVPLGLGLIGPPGSDRMLLAFAADFAAQRERDPGTRFD